MKTNKLSILMALLGFFMLALPACQPDTFEMGDIISKEALKYSITQNAEDPNMIILKSENPGLNPLWVTPMGRSTRVQDTLRIPFEGDYKFVYGVQSAGGFVQADTFRLTITTTNLSYVNDPLWTLLSGGVGEEKTWLLDLDEDAVSKYFAGPLYFYGSEDSWESMILYKSGKTADDVKAALGLEDSWNWEPVWGGNQWLMPAGDYGSMTFSLKGNATVTVDHKMLNRQESGTYFLDAVGKTLRMTDAGPLHDETRDGQVVDWGVIRVMSLTDNTMQLGVFRDKALSGEDRALFVYNYISKEYSDTWVPEDLPEPEPKLPEGWQEDVSQVVSTTITWKLSETTPLNWANLDGSLMNTWNAPGDYPDWLGVHDLSVYEGFSLTMNAEDNSVVYVAPDGTEEEGTYSLDEKGIYTFDGVLPSFPIIGWASFGLTAENQLRILSIEKDAVGNVSGMWVGAKDPDPNKNEYMAYHLVPSMGGGAVDPIEATRKAIVKALTGSGSRTFKPDTGWFMDWVGGAPGFGGGWTSAATFGSDYTSNSWVWNAATAGIAQSASLEFALIDGNVSVTVSQTLTTEHEEGEGDDAVWVTDNVDEDFSQTGTVTIDPVNLTLAIGIPLVDYAGSAARWLTAVGNEGTWFIVPHGGSSLTTVETAGLWLGFTSKEGETTVMHYIIEQ